MAQCCDARDGAAFANVLNVTNVLNNVANVLNNVANVLNNVTNVLNSITPRVVPRRRSHSSKRPIERIRLFRRESSFFRARRGRRLAPTVGEF